MIWYYYPRLRHNPVPILLCFCFSAYMITFNLHLKVYDLLILKFPQNHYKQENMDAYKQTEQS